MVLAVGCVLNSSLTLFRLQSSLLQTRRFLGRLLGRPPTRIAIHAVRRYCITSRRNSQDLREVFRVIELFAIVYTHSHIDLNLQSKPYYFHLRMYWPNRDLLESSILSHGNNVALPWNSWPFFASYGGQCFLGISVRPVIFKWMWFGQPVGKISCWTPPSHFGIENIG